MRAVRRKNALLLGGAVLLGSGAMLLVDGVWQPGYWVKSAVKICLFILLPVLCSKLCKGISLRSLFRFQRRETAVALALGAGVYALILGGYFLLRGVIDFSPVLDNLPQGVTRATFPLVALYISLVNSLLEEFFFRGFAFLALREQAAEGTAALFSALAFALYHTAMMLGWFPLPVFLLALAGLTVGGLLFNWLDRRHGSICTSWLTHMFANFAINTVGFLLFAGG